MSTWWILPKKSPGPKTALTNALCPAEEQHSPAYHCWPWCLPTAEQQMRCEDLPGVISIHISNRESKCRGNAHRPFLAATACVWSVVLAGPLVYPGESPGATERRIRRQSSPQLQERCLCCYCEGCCCRQHCNNSQEDRIHPNGRCMGTEMGENQRQRRVSNGLEGHKRGIELLIHKDGRVYICISVQYKYRESDATEE